MLTLLLQCGFVPSPDKDLRIIVCKVIILKHCLIVKREVITYKTFLVQGAEV
jgi:hypothetical protein